MINPYESYNVIESNLYNEQSERRNKDKLRELKMREKEILDDKSKRKVAKHSFKEMVSNLGGVFDNIDRYIILPQKMKNEKQKLMTKLMPKYK